MNFGSKSRKHKKITFWPIRIINFFKYKYRLIGLDTTWQEKSDNNVEYARLDPGNYTFEVIGINNDGNTSSQISHFSFTVLQPFYSTFWFIGSIALFLSGIGYSFYRLRISSIQSKEKLKRAYDKQLSELEMKALRAQMNPHFIFNSLNSIQKFIFEKDEFAASQYLTKFSRLIRLILNQSNQEYITVEGEIELAKLYIELESLRFDKSFNFVLEIDPSINQFWLLPSMIVQPHLENAIWHGLLHEPNNGQLSLRFKGLNSTQFQIIIEDNGIGRTKAALLRSKQLLKEKSFGLTISKDRLTNLNRIYPNKASLVIEDLYDENQLPNGTRIILTLPIIINTEQ